MYVVNLVAEAGKPVAAPITPLLELEGQRTPISRGRRAPTPPNVFEGVVLSCGCGKGFPIGLDERLGAKITRSVAAPESAQEASLLFLTGASGEVMGISALDGGSHYVPGKVEISVLLSVGVAAPTEDCRLRAIIDASVASCTIGRGRGSHTVGCGPLVGVELESTEYTVTRVEGSNALHVRPELPAGTHRAQLVNYYSADPVSAEDLAREPTLTPVVRQPETPPEQRVALFPGSADTGLMCHVGGDSVFLEGAYGRDKSTANWPLITHWCDRTCMSTPNHRSAQKITAEQYSQYGALAWWLRSATSCKKRVGFALKLQPVWEQATGTLGFLSALNATLSKKGVKMTSTLADEYASASARRRSCCTRAHSCCTCRLLACTPPPPLHTFLCTRR